MSIFGTKDKDVHILTAFYQLEFDPRDPVGSELDKWLLLKRFSYDLPPHVSLEDNWSDYVFSRAVNDAVRSLQEKEGRQYLQEAADIHKMVRTLMDAMANGDLKGDVVITNPGKGLDGPDVYWWNAYEDLQRRAQSLRYIPKLRQPGDPLKEKKPISIEWSIRSDQPAKSILSDLVHELAEGYEVFRRCPVCQSVFIANGRNDQKYCSNRCRNRFAVKNFRSKVTL